MKLPISWLKEYININTSAEKLADKLTLTGLEVESVDSSVTFSGVFIGEVLERTKHPNADKLNVAKVNVGKKILQIVCGAPNLNVGQKVPVALVGAKLDDFEITKANLRGIESNGMICSEKELGLGDNHEGIMVLDKKAPVGGDFADFIGADRVLDVKVFANRPDLMSIRGLAREVAAALGKKLVLTEPKVKETGENSEKYVEVEIENTDLCPRYIARVATAVKVEPSPRWLQDRLVSCGVRPINNIVDISNYVMLEYGQPLHFFDLDKVLNGKSKAKITVRNAKEGETIKTLDGSTRKLSKEMLVIADEKKPIALAGVMGGESTEVSEKTKNILIEAAVFEKSNIRKTSRMLGLRSEAVARFEKGLPLSMPVTAIDRAVELLADLASAKVATGRVDALTKWVWVQHIGLEVSKLKKFLGAEIESDEIVNILHQLGFTADKFDIVKEAKKHLGKPYVFGANFKQNGAEAFDCSYLTDYIYSLIGLSIGHTSLGQMHHGWDVDVDDLKPGDNLFYKGHIEKSAVDHYYKKDENGNHVKMKNEKYPSGIGHNGMYIGNGQVAHASTYDFDFETKSWSKRKDEKTHNVHIVPLEDFTSNPEFLGARRYAENLDDFVAVTVPWWRGDVTTPTDLYEEIARIWGYEKIASTLPNTGNVLAKSDKMLDLVEQTRKLLANIGLTEILTYSFIGKKELEAVGENIEEAPVVANPLVSEQEFLRTSLVPHMLTALGENQFNKESIKFFEIGKVFKKNGKELLPIETRFLCVGDVGGETWPIAYKNGKEFLELKGVFARLCVDLRIKQFDLQKAKSGLGSEILIDGKSVGSLFEVEQKVLGKFGLKRNVAVLLINLDAISEFANSAMIFSAFSKFPKSTRDISAVFDKSAEVGVIQGALSRADTLIRETRIVDIYEGKPLAENEKSVSFRFEIWSDEKTLIDKEVDVVMDKAFKIVVANGGKVRGGS